MSRKECPLCGELMRLHEREFVQRIPGTGETPSQTICEWVCPECDYFEDAEETAET